VTQERALQSHDAPPTNVRHSVLVALCLAAALTYLHRTVITVPVTKIQSDLHLSDVQMGWVLSGFFIAYAAFQIPGGWLADRWGTRSSLAIFSLVWTASVGAMAAASGFATLFACRFIAGTAQAGVFPACVNTIARWFPPTGRALPGGVLTSCMSLGGVVSAALVTSLLGFWSWHAVFLIVSLPGMAWAVWFFAWFRDRPEEHPGVNEAELHFIRGGDVDVELTTSRAKHAEEPVPWLVLFTSRLMLFFCLQQFCRAAAYVFFQTWFPAFLERTRGITTQSAGYLTTVPLMAVVFGGVFGGWLSDRVLRATGDHAKSRSGVALVSMLLSAACMLGAYLTSGLVPAVALISCGAMLSAMTGAVTYVLPIDVGGRHVATVFSVMNMAGNIGGMVSPLAVGYIVDRTDDWNLVLLLLAGVHFVAAVCWSFIDARRPIFEKHLGGSRSTPSQGR